MKKHKKVCDKQVVSVKGIELEFLNQNSMYYAKKACDNLLDTVSTQKMDCSLIIGLVDP